MVDVIVYGCLTVLLVVFAKAIGRQLYETSLLQLELEERRNALGPAAAGYDKMIKNARIQNFVYAVFLIALVILAIMSLVIFINSIAGVLAL